MEVVCIGQMVADIIAAPLNDFEFNVDTTLVDSLVLRNGGDAMNTATDLAKLGVNVGLLGKVGNDLFGKYLLQQAEAYGIATDGIIISEHETTSSVLVLVRKDGERVFIYYGGTNDSFSEDDADLQYIEKAGIVHFGGVYLLPALEGDGITNILKHAKSLNRITTMDVGWDARGKWLRTIEPSLPYLDFFLPSINEARQITKESEPEKIAEFLLNCGVKTVVLKLGKNGCYLCSAATSQYVPGYTVSNVVDTTGAGDAFVAGFLTGLTHNWPLVTCAKFANVLGALAVQKVGATEGITSFDDAYRVFAQFCREDK